MRASVFAQSIPSQLPATLQLALSWLVALVILLGAIPLIWNRILVPIFEHGRRVRRLLGLDERVALLEGKCTAAQRTAEDLDARVYALYAAHVHPLFLCDITGANTFVNSAYCSMLGASRAELMGLGWRAFLPDDEARKYARVWSTALEERRAWCTEIRMMTTQNVLITCMVSTYEIETPDGDVSGYVGIIQPMQRDLALAVDDARS